MDESFEILGEGKKAYFASDFHLGSPNQNLSLIREQKIVAWLDQIKADAGVIFLVGDIFDFWFEYKHVIPKNYTRFLGKLMELRDLDIPIVFFVGNHDLWMNSYFPHEFGIPVYRQPGSFKIHQFSIHIAHGDGLGPGDHKFKFFKSIFTNKLANWAFRWLHPDVGIGLASFWSSSSRQANELKVDEYENARLIQYCADTEAKAHHDIYIMGHSHVAAQIKIGKEATYYNLGEWIKQCHYLEISNNHVKLHRFED